MGGLWGMRCVQVVSIAPSGVNVALAACESTGCSGVSPAGGITSALTKAEEKGPTDAGKVAAERG